jgi:hypothetical protein
MSEESIFAEMRATEKAAAIRRNALAANTVAEYSKDVAECVELLAMLGLELSELR